MRAQLRPLRGVFPAQCVIARFTAREPFTLVRVSADQTCCRIMPLLDQERRRCAAPPARPSPALR